MPTVRFILELKVVTNLGNLWIYLYPWSSMYLYKMFLSVLIVRSAKAAFVSLIVENNSIPAAAQNFLNSPANSVPRSTQLFFWSVSFCNHFRKRFRSFFRILRLHSSCVHCSVKHVLSYQEVFHSIITSRQLFNKCRIHAPYFVSESGKGLQVSEFASGLNKFYVRRLRMQEMSNFWKWNFASFRQSFYRTISCATFIV